MTFQRIEPSPASTETYLADHLGETGCPLTSEIFKFLFASAKLSASRVESLGMCTKSVMTNLKSSF